MKDSIHSELEYEANGLRATLQRQTEKHKVLLQSVLSYINETHALELI